MDTSIKLVWRTDLHLADKAPQSRVDDWTETLLGKLNQVGEIAREVGAAAVLDGGDFFHVKSPTRNSHSLTHRAVAAHAEYPCPVFATIGNHDVKYGDYSFLAEQPMGVLFETGVFNRCYDEHEVFFVHQSGNMLPSVFPFDKKGGWVNGNPFSIPKDQRGPIVRVKGIPYHGVHYDADRFNNIEKGEEDYLVVIAHVLASQAGGTMFESEDIVTYGHLKGHPASAWCFGHWHKDQGVTEITPGKWVVNVGSLSRGSLHQDELQRIPSVAILKFTNQGIEIEQRNLDVLPPEKVFDISGRQRMDIRQETMAVFVDQFKKDLEESQGKPIPDTIMGMEDTPQNVKERALEYWEEAG